MNKWSRVPQFLYDWRERLVADKSGVQTNEDTVTKRPITYAVYDNLDEITSVSVYDGDNITITSTSGVPNAPGAGLLRAYSTTAFDNQGRLSVGCLQRRPEHRRDQSAADDQRLLRPSRRPG